MLLFFSESFENMIRAHFHDVNFLREAVGGSFLSCALLEIGDLALATARDGVVSQREVLALALGVVALSSVFVAEGLVLSVGVPIVVGLEMPVVLFVRVVEVTPYPCELRNKT